MAASNNNVDNDFLLLDDEEDFKMVSGIDASHNFLNFSRRITESSSMKRPVDIQLGIACGKDLLFSRSSLQESLSRVPPRQLETPVIKMASQSNAKKNKMSLDKLVKDVLVHIESCPGQNAYSDDLDRLKPKLESYTSHSRQKV